jgi:hypothetical protein
MDTSPTVSDVLAAIHAGVEYLSRTQRPSGEFATFTGPSPDLTDAEPYPKSVYISTYIVHSLEFVPPEPLTARVLDGVGDFLEAEKEDNGTWNFDGRGEWRIPVDLETMCCAAAALVHLGRRPPHTAYRLLWQVVRPNESAPGGPYYSYVGVVGADRAAERILHESYTHEVDALVNANVLFCCGLLGVSLPGTARFLAEVVRAEEYRARARYCVSPHFLIYTIDRARAAGDAPELSAVTPQLGDFVRGRLPPLEEEVSAFNLACRAVTLLRLGTDPALVQPYVKALLLAQQPDGGWPLWAAGAGFPLNWNRDWWVRWPAGPTSVERGWCWGSPALTTALALETFGRYLPLAGAIE